MFNSLWSNKEPRWPNKEPRWSTRNHDDQQGTTMINKEPRWPNKEPRWSPRNHYDLNSECKCKPILSNETIPKESCNWIKLFLWYFARWHQLRMPPSTICMPQLQPVQLYPNYDPVVRDEGSGQPWDNDRASWSSVLPRTQTRMSQAKVSPSLDHQEPSSFFIHVNYMN